MTLCCMGIYRLSKISRYVKCLKVTSQLMDKPIGVEVIVNIVYWIVGDKLFEISSK